MYGASRRRRVEGHRHIVAATYACTPTWREPLNTMARLSRLVWLDVMSALTMELVADDIDVLFIMHATGLAVGPPVIVSIVP